MKADTDIAGQLRAMRKQTALPPLPPKWRVRGRKPYDPGFDAREALYRVLGVDLTAIEGIDEVHAVTLVSELGTDFSKWPTMKQFTAWLGAPKAITALAHKLARIVYNLVRYGVAYVPRAEAAYAAQVGERLEKRLFRG